MSAVRYKGSTAGVLIAATALCLYRCVHYFVNLIESLSRNSSGYPSVYYSGELVSYLEIMSAELETKAIVICAVMLAAMLCFGISAAIVLLMGTEKLKMPTALYTAGIAAVSALSVKAWFSFMIHLDDMLHMAVMAMIVGAMAMLVFYMRSTALDPQKAAANYNIIICVSVFIMAAVLFVGEKYTNLPEYSPLDILAGMLAAAGISKAAHHDLREDEAEEESDLSEENTAD